MTKKVLIFNYFYYPSKNSGGPVTSIENIVNSCSDNFEFYIVCYNHDWAEKTPFPIETRKWVRYGKANVMYVEDYYLDFSIKHMGKLLDDLRPDLIWFSGVLTPNKKIVTALSSKRRGIPVLFSPRGEVSADRICIKSYKKIPYLKLIKLLGLFNDCYFHGTSNDEIEGIQKFFSPKSSHIFEVPNISIAQQADIVPLHKTKGELKVLFFSRIHHVKNLMYAINAVCRCKKKIIYDIYGPIESKDYWNECLEVYKSAPDNIEINYKGILSKEDMNRTIQEHDCFLFPTINENYGHVIAECLANSRPVILSKGTTPWDDLHERAGYVIPLEDINEFTQKLDYLATLDENEFLKLINETNKYFRYKISMNGAIDGHIRMFNDIILNHKNEQ